LLDANIVSELRKGSRCDANVAAWYAQVESGELFMSVLTLGEIRKGVERMRRRDPAQARMLERWLADLRTIYADRLITVDRDIADEWGRVAAIRTLPIIDGLLAATAKVHSLTLATRNVDDVSGLGAKLLNPFEPQS
jgi:hypothetical protein